MTIAPPIVGTAPIWHAVPPPGWEPVAEVCRDVFDRLSELVHRVNARIATEIPEFAPDTSPMTGEDLSWSTSRNMSGLLHGIAENRAPSAREISFRRLVGQRSASRGLPLAPLIEAFRVGFLEVWAAIAETSLRTDGPAAELLFRGGSRIWQWMLTTGNALTDGYNAELRRRQDSDTRATAHLIDEILRGDFSPDGIRLARELGFDPESAFRIIALHAAALSEETANAIVASLNGGIAKSAQRGRAVLVLTQAVPREVIDSALAKGGVAAGVGLAHDGLTGARAGIEEAERALDVATARGAVCHYDAEWFSIITLAHHASLGCVLESGMLTARDHPHLVDALEAFAENGYSVAEGSRRLRVSPNAFRYRLTRWRALTGWDPWSRDGLIRSFAAIDLARMRTGVPR